MKSTTVQCIIDTMESHSSRRLFERHQGVTARRRHRRKDLDQVRPAHIFLFAEESQSIQQNDRFGQMSQQQAQLEKGLQLLALMLETQQIAVQFTVIQLKNKIDGDYSSKSEDVSAGKLLGCSIRVCREPSARTG